MIGTLRRELLDQVFFWKGIDLSRKPHTFRDYYNQFRCHSGVGGETPAFAGTRVADTPAVLPCYR